MSNLMISQKILHKSHLLTYLIGIIGMEMYLASIYFVTRI